MVAFLAGACSNSQQAEVLPGKGTGGGGGNNGGFNEKPSVTPSFSESQFKKDQWIEWKGQSANGQTECIQWKWTGFYSEGIKIESRIFKNCTQAQTYRVEHILFDPQSGKILENYYVMADGTVIAGEQKGSSIFAYIYGNPKQEKEIFSMASVSINDQKYPSFQRQKKLGYYYLNSPSTAFHAVLIQWSQARDGVSWNYKLNNSQPVIEHLPAGSLY